MNRLCAGRIGELKPMLSSQGDHIRTRECISGRDDGGSSVFRRLREFMAAARNGERRGDDAAAERWLTTKSCPPYRGSFQATDAQTPFAKATSIQQFL